MPIFADLVLSNEVTIKEHLRLIFIDISEPFINSNDDINNDNEVGDSSGGGF
jgi:hypothetical protein